MKRDGYAIGLRAAMAVGYAFLYVPLVCVVVYSFNASRLVTVWGGFSTKWYGALFANGPILEAARRSFAIAAMAATGAVLIGTLFFLIPACLLLAYLSWPFFQQAYAVGEISSNAGGLIRWPIKFVIPAGFVMLALQGLSEAIKRIAALQGYVVIDAKYERPTQ